MASVDSKDHSKDDSTTRVGQAWAHPAMQFLLETLSLVRRMGEGDGFQRRAVKRGEVAFCKQWRGMLIAI